MAIKDNGKYLLNMLTEDYGIESTQAIEIRDAVLRLERLDEVTLRDPYAQEKEVKGDKKV